VLIKRRSDLTKIAALCGYSHRSKLIDNFSEALQAVANKRLFSWADAALFDAEREERMMLEFLRFTYGLSRNGRFKGSIMAARAVKNLQKSYSIELKGE